MNKVYVVMHKFEGEETISEYGSQWESNNLIDVFEHHEDAVAFVIEEARKSATEVIERHSHCSDCYTYNEWTEGNSCIEPDEEIYTYLHYETDAEAINYSFVIIRKYMR